MKGFSKAPPALMDRLGDIDLTVHDIWLVPERYTDEGAACFQPMAHAIRALLLESDMSVGVAIANGVAFRTLEEHDDSIVLPLLLVFTTVTTQILTAALGEVLGSYLTSVAPRGGRVVYREMRADGNGELWYREITGTADDVIAVLGDD